MIKDYSKGLFDYHKLHAEGRLTRFGDVRIRIRDKFIFFNEAKYKRDLYHRGIKNLELDDQPICYSVVGWIEKA
jgi:hypothetical protein